MLFRFVMETAALHVTLMDSVQAYFDYSASTGCGIPSVTLEGTITDWERVRDGARQLLTFDMAWWSPYLLPLLDEFVQACAGRPDPAFWCSFFKLLNMSGGPYVNGYVVNLFPYLGGLSTKKPVRNSAMVTPAQAIKKAQEAERRRKANPFMVDAPGSSEGFDLTLGAFGEGLSRAPLTWKYYGDELKMDIVAGFVGMSQHPRTLCVRPEVGWAVRDLTGDKR